MKSELMPAVIVCEGARKGEWNELSLEMVARPSPREGEALVQVEACSVNRADLLQRRGLYPPPPGASDVLGLDFAGTVVETIPGATEWRTGDRVFGIVAGGGYGRFVAVSEDHLVRIPEKLSYIEAAAAAEVFFTAYYNVFDQAEIRPRDVLLVHGAGSGVGTAAVQLAAALGVSAIVTGGSSEKIRRALELGAMAGINYKEEDFAERALEITAGEGVDVVLDWIGASYLAKHLQILKTRGRLVCIGLMGGSKGEINLAPVVSKRLKIIGSVLRGQSREEKAAIARGFAGTVLPLLESGRVRPVIDRVFPIRQAEEAHRYLRQGDHFGKVVLSWETFED